MMLAVPAGTCSSLWLSSSWYAVIPKNPHATIQPRSRPLGAQSRRAAAHASRTIEAVAKRTKDNPTTPRSGAATRMAGNALAHSATTPRPAMRAVLILT